MGRKLEQKFCVPQPSCGQGHLIIAKTSDEVFDRQRRLIVVFASPLVMFFGVRRLLQRSTAARIWLLPRFDGQRDALSRADLLKRSSGAFSRVEECPPQKREWGTHNGRDDRSPR